MSKAELMTYISDIISDLEVKGVSGVTITSYVKALKSWVRFNGKRLDEKVNVPESEARYADEVVPRPEEVQALFDHSSSRVKVAASLMAFSGLRPGSLGTADGSDGLKVGDLPEMEVKDGKVTYTKVPTLIVVRKKISKTRLPFVTFAPAQACEYLRQYLEDRGQAGGGARSRVGHRERKRVQPQDRGERGLLGFLMILLGWIRGKLFPKGGQGRFPQRGMATFVGRPRKWFF
jgi:integrase